MRLKVTKPNEVRGLYHSCLLRKGRSHTTTTQHNSDRVSSENLPVQATLVSAALVICEFNDRQMHTAIEV